MATANAVEIKAPNRLSDDAQKNVTEFFMRVCEAHGRDEELINKMDAIDIAYARYVAFKDSDNSVVDGVDMRRSGDVNCDIFSHDKVTPPIVVSQVDSYVAYLADVFLSGSPIFPVVSNPSNKKYAEQLETLLDDHASLGGYARQLAMFLRDGVKFNVSALEADWSVIEQFQVAESFDVGNGPKIKTGKRKFTRLKRLNPRNVFWDKTVAPGDVAELGDYAGYVERITRTKLKRELNNLNEDNAAYNISDAMASTTGSAGSSPSNIYSEDPQISDYITNLKSNTPQVDWDVWFDGTSKRKSQASYGQQYERAVIYARIMPADFGIIAPAANTPQIWKFVIINGTILIAAKRIVSAYNYLPILMGQPLEDGLGLQTQSVGESEIPFQEAAATLINIRFAASRRAVSDRAIYDDGALDPKQVNSPSASAKIPASISSLSGKKLPELYYPIPFDSRGTETAIQDAQTIVQFSKELHGMNSPRQGQFQKGNKSVQEWNDTMGGSDQRLRLPAMILEHQVFAPMKSILVLNIYQYGDDTVVVSQKTGDVISIDLTLLRKQVLAFRIADGYTPKSKLASVEMINTGLQMIANSPILQQVYGASIAPMFAHLMQLGGVRGLEEYNPQYQAEGVGSPTGQEPSQQPAPAQIPQQLEQPLPAGGNIP